DRSLAVEAEKRPYNANLPCLHCSRVLGLDRKSQASRLAIDLSLYATEKKHQTLIAFEDLTLRAQGVTVPGYSFEVTHIGPESVEKSQRMLVQTLVWTVVGSIAAELDFARRVDSVHSFE